MPNARAKGRAVERRPKLDPFHVVPRHIGKELRGYSIMLHNRPFLEPAGPESIDGGAHAIRITRPQAYAIARLLNADTKTRKWADRFEDPYA